MTKKTYGGILIPKGIVYALLNESSKGEIDGLALSVPNFDAVDIQIWQAIRDQNGNIHRVQLNDVTEKLAVAGQAPPYSIKGITTDYIFFRSDTTLRLQSQSEDLGAFGFAYFTKEELMHQLNNPDTDHVLITGGDETNSVTMRRAFTLVLSNYPAINDLSEEVVLRNTTIADGEPIYISGMPCPPYWVKIGTSFTETTPEEELLESSTINSSHLRNIYDQILAASRS